MAARPHFLFGFSLYLVLSGVCLARRAHQKQFNECQLERLNALEPDHRLQLEAGVTESWNTSRPELRCAGVAVERRTLYTNGLHLPYYSNGGQMHFIVQGRGVIGVGIPGCAETYDNQKLHHVKEGDIVAIPVGISHWTYNNGDTPLVAITLIDTANEEGNQLDPNPRRFYLGGNPKEETAQGGQNRHKNMLGGFERGWVEDAFNVDEEIARKLQGDGGETDQMITVRGDGRIRLDGCEEEGEGRGNGGDEEAVCNIKIRQNIGEASEADLFNPLAGRIGSTDLQDLPILKWVGLSAEYVVLYGRGMYAPHWKANGKSIIYVTRGRGGVQVVNEEGRLVLDGNVGRGQLVVVPQNYAVAHQAWEEGFEFICFRTHAASPLITPILGKQSFFEATPAKVLAAIYALPLQQARHIKHARHEAFLLSPPSQSPFSIP